VSDQNPDLSKTASEIEAEEKKPRDGFDLIFEEHEIPQIGPIEKELLAGMLGELRQQVSKAKLQWHLRTAEHPQLVAAGNEAHAEKIKGQVRALQDCLQKVEGFIEEGGVIPEPTNLQVMRKGVTVASEVSAGDGPPAA